MNKLNVKEINYSYNTYKISQLGSDNMELPEYGVVFADGRCVSCNFGSHFVAYGIGALLLIAEKLPLLLLFTFYFNKKKGQLSTCSQSYYTLTTFLSFPGNLQ